MRPLLRIAGPKAAALLRVAVPSTLAREFSLIRDASIPSDPGFRRENRTILTSRSVFLFCARGSETNTTEAMNFRSVAYLEETGSDEAISDSVETLVTVSPNLSEDRDIQQIRTCQDLLMILGICLRPNYSVLVVSWGCGCR